MALATENRNWFIYVLTDPDTGFVRYVGFTIDVTKRLRDHIKPSRLAGNTHRDRWIVGLFRQGKRPKLTVIESGKGDWRHAERLWIAYLRWAGIRLVNQTDGGDGALGRRHSLAAKQMMSQKRKGRKPSEFAIARTKLLRTGVPRDPETIEKMRRAKAGVKFSEGHRLKLSLAAKNRPPPSEENRQKRREKMLSRGVTPKSPEWLQAVRDGVARRDNAAIGAAKKAFWESLSKEKRSEIARRGVATRRARRAAEGQKDE